MNLYNEYGVLQHEPTKQLQEEVGKMVHSYFKTLVLLNPDIPLVELRLAIGDIVAEVEGVGAEMILRRQMKKRKEAK